MSIKQLTVVGLVVIGVLGLLQTPLSFEKPKVVVVQQGASVESIGKLLKDSHIVISQSVFMALVRILNYDARLQAGTYVFEHPENTSKIIRRLVDGDRGSHQVKVTIHEGATAEKIGARIIEEMGFLDSNFVSNAKNHEGYLFPDTYFLDSTMSSEEIIALMLRIGEEKTALVHQEALERGYDWNVIVIIASLLEKEVQTPEDMKRVSGIIWNRLEKKIPLQIDASLGYVFDKTSAELTLDDLMYDSPYNTYTHIGLPPTPIANPGLIALDAALHPERHDFLFYLSDSNGVIHYAKTFAEHQKNKRKYIR